MHSTQPEVIHAGQIIPASRFLRLPRSRPTVLPVPGGGHHGEGNKLNSPPNPPGDRSIELAHDARNLISALDLYCELLASPGVLAPGFGCYAEDLRKLASSGARLIGALAGSRADSLSRRPPSEDPSEIDALRLSRRPFPRIDDLGAELDALEGQLRALAGPGVRLEVESRSCAGHLALNSEELLRILFNLVANAVEAMAATPAELRRSPFLRITAQRGGGASFAAGFPDRFPDRHAPHGGDTVVLSVRDNGPGIAPSHLRHIFDAGFSTRHSDDGDESRGLGLAIVQRLVTAAGGAVRAVSPAGLGARFDIELPILPPEAAGARPEDAGLLRTMKIPDLQQISAQIEKEA